MKKILIYLFIFLLVSATLTILITWGTKEFPWTKSWLRKEPIIRPPTVAGQFYPADPIELEKVVQQMMDEAPKTGLRDVRAILVPHAGYRYSGDVAATSFRQIDKNFSRVFILAANHRGDAPLRGVSIPNVTHYGMPGSEIQLSAIAEKLRRKKIVTQEPLVHTAHMIEVELPFLTELKKNFGGTNYEIIPIILGHMDREQIQQLANILAQYANDKTLFVFSVDLSHFFPDEKAQQLDEYTITSLMSRDDEATGQATTDGNQVLLTMLDLAEIKKWEPAFLMYKNSGSVNQDMSRVVGYASIVFHKPLLMNHQEKKELVGLARQTVEKVVKNGEPIESDPSLADKHHIFNASRGVFVTLKKAGKLRGCIGNILPRESIVKAVQDNAVNAALHDRRFTPVTENELDNLTVSVSILDYPQRIKVSDPKEYLEVLQTRKDGVILMHQGRRSTFLPQVWENLPEPEMFLNRLCNKQGKPANCWQDPNAVLYRYVAYEFGEEEFVQ